MARAAALAATLLVVSACGTADGAAPPTDARFKIVATTTIMGDVARTIAPPDADVSVLMEPGADPHTFEPSARQIAEVAQADLVVANGGGLEEGLLPALEEARAAGVPVFSATEHASPLSPGDTHATDVHTDDATTDGQTTGETTEDQADDAAGDEHGDAHDGGAVDPHIWMDPVRMADVVTALGARLGEVTGRPTDAAASAEAYAEQLRDLDREIADLLTGIPAERRTLVTNHASLAYFADRYDLRIVGTVIPGLSTGGEPSAQDLEQLAAVMRREDVTAVFTDSTASPRLAEALAREVGADVEVVELYTGSLGAEGEAATYLDMLGADAERIAGALAP